MHFLAGKSQRRSQELGLDGGGAEKKHNAKCLVTAQSEVRFYSRDININLSNIHPMRVRFIENPVFLLIKTPVIG